MGICTLVSLYTSRIVLNTLGIEDFGVYGIVGSVLGLFSFLNSSMACSVSRFITVNMCFDDENKLKQTFSSAMIMHIYIAVIVFLLIEIIGVWFLHNNLKIPTDRLGAADLILQCGAIGVLFTITQVPYNATILSYERMGAYSIIEIANVILKLAIVFLIQVSAFDKLKVYAILSLLVTIIITMTYRIYCKKNFAETHFQWSFDKVCMKQMFRYFSWDLFGNMSVVAREQGNNIILNNFFGVIVNAAVGVASTVNNVLTSFVNNISIAFRPQIIKNYARKNYEKMNSLLCSASEFSLYLFGCLFIPLTIEMPYIMRLWLCEVPDYSVTICRLLLIASLFSVESNIVSTGLHATGEIMRMSYITGSMLLMSLPISCYMLKILNEPYLLYVVYIGFNLLVLAVKCILLNRYVKAFDLWVYVLKTFKLFICIAVSFAVSAVLHSSLEEGFVRLVIITCISILSMSTFMYLWIFDKCKRDMVLQYIAKYFNTQK